MQVIKYKYAEKRIAEMQDSEILPKVAECFLRIHIITGWNLPDDKIYVKTLTEEFMIKLKDSFSNLNFAEIVHAFRKNGIGVKDWGKNMNLDLICSVLSDYCNERSVISENESKVNYKPPPQKIYTDDELDNIQRWYIECFYQRYLNGIIPKKIPDYFLPLLIKDGFMADGSDFMEGFFTDYINLGKKNIYLFDKNDVK